ncbi:hypothetical protein L486_04014 [Kwoniella mangroviensis CBS 10435]|uniref:Small ribosomal subunit protein uS7 domain-containing protein n=1 Tax=Kwoniella mangroviensis CBS 10435 TaxID=1331196 RepID=A0A1B9IR47_9TREE|nr:hypothetical protein L486_04014 [Kwoniella mangroviensis CBS 10435]OCF74911.1 hypothetical protein I204_03754 [Kwoniella mangroviensis CBS 8886]
MSLRTPLTAFRRTFVTSARSLAEPPTAPAQSGFSPLRDLLASSSSSSSSSHFAPAPITSESQTATRGYDVHSIPPKADPTIDLFTNCLMKDGKKDEAQKMVSRILTMLNQSTSLPPQPLLKQAIISSSPSIKILSMRKSAKTILTPRALTERQRTRQGIAWLLKASEKGRKGGVSRDQRIAREILGVLEGQSDVFKWLEERHKIAYLNRSNMTAR